MFSYGSGLAATLYSLKVTQDATPGKHEVFQQERVGACSGQVVQQLLKHAQSVPQGACPTGRCCISMSVLLPTQLGFTLI